MKEQKDYGRFVKALQILTGILLLILAAVGVWLIQKYNIKVSNIKNLSEMITGGVLTVSLILIGVSVVKSFVLIFPPAVIFSVCGYMLPNYPLALAVNLISVVLSLSIPYFLGRFAGAGMIDTLKGKFKAVRKIDDFVGMNETAMTAIVKFSGVMPGDLSSLLFGAMNVSYRNYMIGATLGNIPLVIVYTLFGTLLKSVGEQPWVVAIPVVIIVLFLLISGVLVKKTVDRSKPAPAPAQTDAPTETE
ncbi:MAG: VTT domain-containing protein [Clostridia bacterium]|nr:VTT domain-containing protein [Clostridia bacterium]